MLPWPVYRELLGLPADVLLDGVRAVLDLHTPDPHASHVGSPCPECHVSFPCITVHVLCQRLGVRVLHNPTRGAQ
jgi:hypothetical protein